MKHILLPAIALLAACATAPASDPSGRVLHYTRSNSDGAEAEYITTYQPSASRVAVYKMRERCTNAAYVTAEFDTEMRQATRLVGGRLKRDGTQEAFAWLEHDPAGKLIVRTEGPDAAPSETAAIPADAPWRLYDFDFADWNALAAPPRAGVDIPFSAALAWPEPAEDGKVLRILGRATARFVGAERHAGVSTYRYRVDGGAFDGAAGGDLWLDRADGTLVEARFGLPNHPGYTDFRLVRTGATHGEAAWNARLASHWEGCAPQRRVTGAPG